MFAGYYLLLTRLADFPVEHVKLQALVVSAIEISTGGGVLAMLLNGSNRNISPVHYACFHQIPKPDVLGAFSGVEIVVVALEVHS